MIFSYLQNMQSHPSWVCGLKPLVVCTNQKHILVTPFVGVWIETTYFARGSTEVKGHTLRGCVD